MRYEEHIVELAIPDGVPGDDFSRMCRWAVDRCGARGYAILSRVDRSDPRHPREVVQWRFRDQDIAQAFSAAFASSADRFPH